MLAIWTILDDLKMERRLKCQISFDIVDVDTLDNLTSFHPNFNSSSGAALTIRGRAPHMHAVCDILILYYSPHTATIIRQQNSHPSLCLEQIYYY